MLHISGNTILMEIALLSKQEVEKDIFARYLLWELMVLAAVEIRHH